MKKETILYQFIYQDLLTQIYIGNLPDGRSLPTLAQLCEQYQVSVTTVRKALSCLEEDGFICTAQGRKPRVTYRADLEQTQLKGIKMLMQRKEAILDVYDTITLLFPELMVQGAMLCGKTQLMELADISDHLADTHTVDSYTPMAPFYSYLLAQLGNPLLMGLKKEIDMFIRIPYIPAGPAQLPFRPASLLEQGAPQQLITLIKEKQFRQLYTQLCRMYQDNRRYIASYLDTFPPCEGKSVSFYWLADKEQINLYTAIIKDLIRGMDTGLYPDGTLLPSIAGLIEKYQVSEITARKALSVLNDLGIIYSVNGKGSVVTSKNIRWDRLSIHKPGIYQKQILYFHSLCLILLLCKTTLRASFPQISAATLQTLRDAADQPQKCMQLIWDQVDIHIPYRALHHICAQLNDLLLWGYYLKVTRPQTDVVRDICDFCAGNLIALEKGDAELFVAQSYALFDHLFHACRDQLVRLGISEAKHYISPQPIRDQGTAQTCL